MGIKKQKKDTRKSKRDLTLWFDVNTGKLFIVVSSIDQQFKNSSIVFDINGDDEIVELDVEGKAMLKFDKQKPAVQYFVKIKDKGSLQDDQKLAFWY